MALPSFLGMSEGLELLIIITVLLLLALFIIRRILFSLRMRRIRKENMELASHMKAKLKTARFRSSSDFDQDDDEMFRPAVRAKAPVIPASYEARISRARKKATRKRKVRKAARKPARKRKAGKR